MPKASLAAKATVVQEIKLEPKLKRRLLNEMKTYEELEAQYEAIGQAMATHKDTVTKLLAKEGVKKLKLEGGYSAFVVEGTYSFLDKQKLIALGVTTEMLEEATTIRPKSPYTRITHPGSKKQHGDE